MSGTVAPPRDVAERATFHGSFPDAPQPPRSMRPRWTELNRVRVLGLVAIILALVALGLLLPKKTPNVVLETRSQAVLFVPSQTLDLVGAATPRHGLRPDGTPFTGILFTLTLPDDSSSVRADSSTAALADTLASDSWVSDSSVSVFVGTPVPTSRTMVHELHRLEVTPACAVRLEHYVRSLIRLDIEQPVTSRGSCTMSVDLTLSDSGRVLPVERRRPVVIGAPATLIFSPSQPLHFRSLPVKELRFETSESGTVQSAILNARLELPEIGGAATLAHLGDAVTLGALKGNVAEMVVRDTIRALFKGTATRPVIARRDLRPPVLQHLAHTHWRLGVTFVIAAFGLAAKFLPKSEE